MRIAKNKTNQNKSSAIVSLSDVKYSLSDVTSSLRNVKIFLIDVKSCLAMLKPTKRDFARLVRTRQLIPHVV